MGHQGLQGNPGSPDAPSPPATGAAAIVTPRDCTGRATSGVHRTTGQRQGGKMLRGAARALLRQAEPSVSKQLQVTGL